ncbi:MAG: RNA polymerase subunit sigma-70 [Planctomycetaceae bacterium]|nr:RNA polymerase subunit sigma-70 [Planctomycetaceae bacterium]
MALTQALFNAMVEEHGPVLYRMAFRMLANQHDAEDVVQEAFRSAWKSRESYKSELGERAWLAAILRRRVVDRWRKNCVRTVSMDESLLQLSVAGEDPLANEFDDRLQGALQQLPDQLRETLLLLVVGELTHQEVADMLGIPIGTVLSRVSRARTRMRSLLVMEAQSNSA